MTGESFYYILPELALSISLDKDNDALMIVKKYCDEQDYIQAILTESGQLNLTTDELATGIYCGLDPIAIITCVGLATIGRCWWATTIFSEVFNRTIELWDKRPKKKKKQKKKVKKQLELF